MEIALLIMWFIGFTQHIQSTIIALLNITSDDQWILLYDVFILNSLISI